MNSKIKKVSFLITILVLFFSLFMLKNKYSKNKYSKIEFEENNFDFGNIKKNQAVKKYFVYKNIGEAPILISNIQSSCGCTIPIWTEEEMDSGKRDSILIQYDSKKVGKFSKSVYVHYNSKKNKPYKLIIRGFVYND